MTQMEPNVTTADSAENQHRLRVGEACLLLGIFTILGTEVVVTMFNIGLWFEWSSLVLGVVSSVGILVLGNGLYKGNKQVLAITRVWVKVLLAFALFPLAYALVFYFLEGYQEAGPNNLQRFLGVNALWISILKSVVYGGFSCMLVKSGSMLDFLAHKRGETLTAAVPAPVTTSAPTGTGIELTADQSEALAGLSTAVRWAAIGLTIAGALMVILAIKSLSASAVAGFLGLVEGGALFTLAFLLQCPAISVRELVQAPEKNTGYLVKVLVCWQGLFKAKVVLILIVGVVQVLRFVLG